MFLFHGWGVNASYMEKMAKALTAAVPGSLAISLQGLGELGLTTRFSTPHMRTPTELLTEEGRNLPVKREWFSMRQNRLSMLLQIFRRARRINRYIDARRDAYGLTDADIALVGFSQGGAMALYTGFRRRNPVACLVSHSGIYPGFAPVRSRPPVLFLYGGRDESIGRVLFERTNVRLHALNPQTQTVQMNDLGHYMSRDSVAICADFVSARLDPPAATPSATP